MARDERVGFTGTRGGSMLMLPRIRAIVEALAGRADPPTDQHGCVWCAHNLSLSPCSHVVRLPLV
mgnify:CR=1 FL=1